MVKHLCEICQAQYATIPEAEGCEAQGILGPRYRAGLTLIRTDTKTSAVLENTFILLKKEKNSGHDRVYRAGSTVFAPDDDPSEFLDHWGWGQYTGRDIEQRVRKGELRLPTPIEFVRIEELIQGCRREIERFKVHQGVYSRPSGIVADIIQCLESCPTILHYQLPQ